MNTFKPIHKYGYVLVYWYKFVPYQEDEEMAKKKLACLDYEKTLARA